jgi:hypothetical protein
LWKRCRRLKGRRREEEGKMVRAKAREIGVGERARREQEGESCEGARARAK